jgi:DNA-binding NarL/FixJ family response regulator
MDLSIGNRPNELSGNGDAGHATKLVISSGFQCDCRIVIVESSAFLRDCILRSARGFTQSELATFSSLEELRDYRPGHQPTAVLVSILSLSAHEVDREFALLSEIDPQFRTLVLAPTDDLNKALAALSQGANGFISMNVGFDIVIQALRFISAGGTYVPAQCLVAARRESLATSQRSLPVAVTPQEAAVIQAVRQGKPNKVIAFELNLCENTVKVHLRNIMKKLNAKNRTEVAVKAETLMPSQIRNVIGVRNYR